MTGNRVFISQLPRSSYSVDSRNDNYCFKRHGDSSLNKMNLGEENLVWRAVVIIVVALGFSEDVHSNTLGLNIFTYNKYPMNRPRQP